MKTARRQELRTNELAQQIDHISDYVKQNIAMLAIIIVAAAAVTAGGFWYVKNRQNQVMSGWAMLNDPEVLKDTSSAVTQFRTLAEENHSRALSLAAWLRIGEIAMSRLSNPEASASSQPAADANWSETATSAYQRVIDGYSEDVAAVGEATIALGVLAEDKSDMDSARKHYQRIIDDPRFAQTPFALQAKYRLDGLARWSKPIVFAPAPITVPTIDPLLSPTNVMNLPLLPTSAPSSTPGGGVPAAPLPTTRSSGS